MARQLRDATLSKYRVLFRQLKQFAKSRGLRYIHELDVNLLRQFRATWPDGNLSTLKKLERMKAFFRFVQENGWIAANPAAMLKNPRVNQPPTLPFTDAEMQAILDACDEYPDNYGRTGQGNARQIGRAHV